MRATTYLLRKVITLPRLSPTHSSARIIQRLVPTGGAVKEYEPVLTLICSSDIISDPADRVAIDHTPTMLIECMEEGIVQWNEDVIDNNKWLDVGTAIGEIHEDDDDDDDNEEWTWQAYLHDNIK